MSESQSIKIGSKKMYKPNHSEKAFTNKTLNHSLDICDLISLVLLWTRDFHKWKSDNKNWW